MLLFHLSPLVYTERNSLALYIYIYIYIYHLRGKEGEPLHQYQFSPDLDLCNFRSHVLNQDLSKKINSISNSGNRSCNLRSVAFNDWQWGLLIWIRLFYFKLFGTWWSLKIIQQSLHRLSLNNNNSYCQIHFLLK